MRARLLAFGEFGLAGDRVSTRKNALMSMGGQGVTLALSLLAAFITARWLGPSGRGVFSMTTSGAYVAASLFSLGAGVGLSTLIARRVLNVRTAAFVTAGITLVAGLVSLVLSAIVAPFAAPEMAVVVSWLPIAVAVTLFSMLQTSTAIGAGLLRASVSNTVLTGVAQVIGYAVAAQVASPSASTAIAVWAFAQGAGATVGWMMLVVGSFAPRVSVAPHARELAHLSLAAFPGLILGMANFRLDVFLLGVWSSAAQVGLYSMAALGVSALAIAPSALGQALTSRYGDTSDDPATHLRRGMSIALGVATVLGLLAVPAARLVVPWLLGPEYLGTVPMLYALIPGFVLFSTCYVSSGYVNVVMGRPWLNGRVAGLSLAVDLILLGTLAPRYGGMGAAVASSIAYACGAALNVLQLRKVLFGPRVAVEACGPGNTQRATTRRF